MFTVEYTYSKALREALFVATGRHHTFKSIVVKPEDLSPQARANLLASYTYTPDYHRVLATTADSLKNAEALQDFMPQQIALAVTTDVEPDHAAALAHVIEQLQLAAEVASDIRAALADKAAQEKADAAVRLEAAIVDLVDAPLGRWLAKDADARFTLKGGIDTYNSPLPSDVRRLRELDPRLAARIAEAAAEAKVINARLDAEELANAQAVTALIAECGTTSQMERHEAGVLPEQERRELIGSVLFANFSAHPAYDPIGNKDVPVCAEDCAERTIKYKAEIDNEHPLTAEQWEALKAIQQTAEYCGHTSVVNVRVHEGFCAECAVSAERLGARVTITFAGEEFRHEYAL